MDEYDDSGVAFGVISLVCGILSIICCCFVWLAAVAAVAAIVLAIMSFNREGQKAKGFAVAGLICGIAGLAIALFLLVAIALRSTLWSTLNPDTVENVFEKIDNL